MSLGIKLVEARGAFADKAGSDVGRRGFRTLKANAHLHLIVMLVALFPFIGYNDRTGQVWCYLCHAIEVVSVERCTQYIWSWGNISHVTLNLR